MTRTTFAAAALLLAALPTFAQTKSLTPPDVLGAAKTIQFTTTFYRNDKPVEVSYATLAQPNKAYVMDENFNTKAVDTVYVSDGKLQTEYSQSRNRYTKTEVAADFQDIESRTLAFATLGDFYDPKSFARFQHSPSDAPDTFRMSVSGGKAFEVLSVDTQTGLPKSLLVVAALSASSTRPLMKIVFSDWKLNAPVDDSKFAYTPPADAKLAAVPKLLANGTPAPDFTVQNKDGHPVKLSDCKGKTVVLDFWATWCGPCQLSLPHTTEMVQKYAAKNVVVLAVNVWDTPAAFQAWLPKHPEYAPLNFAIDPNPDQSKSVASALYGVSGIPTQYVIGPDGKIIKSIVGYEQGDTQLEDALK